MYPLAVLFALYPLLLSLPPHLCRRILRCLVLLMFPMAIALPLCAP